MLFDYDFTVPAGTSQLNPIEQIVTLTKGRITLVRVMFPPGPATLVYVVIRHNLLQLVPANPDASLNFDETLIETVMDYEMRSSPYEIKLVGWSPLAVYDHNITVQFEMQPATGQTTADMQAAINNQFGQVLE